jgi:cardiolipin synthase
MSSPWWLVGLAGIGVLAIGTVVITLFFKLGRRPSRVWSVDAPPLDSDAFLRGVAGVVNSPLHTGGTAELLNNGDAYFPRILEDVERARSTINFAVYIWEPGEMSERMLALLTRKATEGVLVRVLLDAVGGLRIPGDAVARLEQAGGRINRFRPAVFGKLLRLHKRNHRRAIVIDGSIGYLGGAAIADKWKGDARSPDEWRDSMVRVTGTAADAVQSAFTELWAYTCGEILTGSAFFPSHVEQPAQELPPAARRLRRHIAVVSSPSDDEYPLRLFFILTFLAARERLYLSTPYFVPDANTRAIVARRARQGVDVRILVPGGHTDAIPIRLTGRHYYDELLAAGVRIYEYEPTMMHVKLCVADGAWSIAGSANMDIRSKELNNENVIGIQDRAFAADVERTFHADLERAREITLAEWRKRPWHARVVERAWALFAEQY